LTTEVQAKPDPFAVGGKSMKPKAGGGPACRVGDAPAKSERKITREPKPPVKAPEVTDISDPAICQVEDVETVAVDQADDRPDKVALERLVERDARKAFEAMKEASDQRLHGFLAAAEHLKESARLVNEDKDVVLAFVEKAFSIVGASLIGVGLAAMAGTGAVGLLKGLITAALTLGKDAVAASVGNAARGDEVNWEGFRSATLEAISRQSLLVGKLWDPDDLSTRFLNAPYPHRVAPAAVAGTEAISEAAHRLQFTTSVTSWANTVNAVKGGDTGTLVFDVTFDPSGSYSVDNCEASGMGDKFAQLMADPHNDGVKTQKALTLYETLTAPTGGMKVTVRDQSHASYQWDPAQKAITTPDNELMHHRVGAWGAANGCKDKAPILAAHRFLFEVLGAKTFGELGVAG